MRYSHGLSISNSMVIQIGFRFYHNLIMSIQNLPICLVQHLRL